MPSQKSTKTVLLILAAALIIVIAICACGGILTIAALNSIQTPAPISPTASIPPPTNPPPPTSPPIPTASPTNTPSPQPTSTSIPTSTPIPTPTVTPTSLSAGCPGGCTTHRPGCDIKGNISLETEEKIYHMPGQRDYQKTEISPERGERWFCTEQEAREAGWRKAKR